MDTHICRLVSRVVRACRSYDGSTDSAKLIQGWADSTANAIAESVGEEFRKALRGLDDAIEESLYCTPISEQPNEIGEDILRFISRVEELGWSESYESDEERKSEG